MHSAYAAYAAWGAVRMSKNNGLHGELTENQLTHSSWLICAYIGM